MAVTPPVCDFGRPMPDFNLPDAIAGRVFKPAAIRGAKATLVMFICNHCPYVRTVLDRILRDATELQTKGVGVVAISSNDIEAYPQDSPEHMKALALEKGFTFPYLFDQEQEAARSFGAKCTPDFFGYNAMGELQYRGRLDAFARKPAPADAERELYQAMLQIATSGKGPEIQHSSMGCSIKWKAQ